MKFICPICKSELKQYEWRNWDISTNKFNKIKLATRYCAKGGTNYFNTHALLDKYGGYFDLTLNIDKYSFRLDYLNKETTIYLIEEFNDNYSFKPKKKLSELVKIKSILDLPWSHKAQVINKIKLYTLFS